MLLGLVSRKSAFGTHPSQNVPMAVEPVSSRVMVYWFCPGASWVAVIEADALSAMVELLTLFVRPGLDWALHERSMGPLYSVESE